MLEKSRVLGYNYKSHAGVAELADAPHSKCGGFPCRFESGHRHHVGAKSALLRRLFMPMAKKTSSARSLAPPFQIEPAVLGFDLVLGANLETAASILLRYSIMNELRFSNYFIEKRGSFYIKILFSACGGV
jgi:hypothetical protein